jgi:threonine dehydrogenase-like Zn-dependent dehydrogenase
LTAYLVSRLPGVELELVDLRAEREQVCSQLGFGFALPEQARRQRDLVFHASGSVSGLKTALELAAAEATIVEQSWFGAREATLALGGWFHSGRVTLRSSQVGRVSPNARARFAHRERLELAISLLSDARLDALLEEACPFEALPAAMNALSSPESGRLCQLIRY